MKSAGLLNYDINRLEREMRILPESLWPKNAAAKLARWKADLPIARRREMKRLATVLNNKADVYLANVGRIYVYGDARFTVNDAGELFYADTRVNPNDLTDGNGRMITEDSKYS